MLRQRSAVVDNVFVMEKTMGKIRFEKYELNAIVGRGISNSGHPVYALKREDHHWGSRPEVTDTSGVITSLANELEDRKRMLSDMIEELKTLKLCNVVEDIINKYDI